MYTGWRSQPTVQSWPLFPEFITKARISVMSVLGEQQHMTWVLKVYKGSLSWSEGMHVVLTKGKIGQVGTAVPLEAFRAAPSDTEVVVEFQVDVSNFSNVQELSKFVFM